MVNFGMDYTLQFDWINGSQNDTQNDFMALINHTAMKPDFNN